MVCLIVFTSRVANTSAAMPGATTTSGVLLKISFFQCADQLAEAGDGVAAYQDCGLFQYRPRGAGIGDEIARGVTGLDGDRVGIGQLLGDGLPCGVAEIGRLCVFGSAPRLQIGQVVRARERLDGIAEWSGPAARASRRLAAYFACGPRPHRR